MAWQLSFCIVENKSISFTSAQGAKSEIARDIEIRRPKMFVRL